MTLPVNLTRAAQQEFDEAVDWYDQQSGGLGARFTRAVRTVLERIRERPELHAVVEADVRQAIVPKFPYSILYRIRANDIVVIAVFHSSRDPVVWQRRM